MAASSSQSPMSKAGRHEASAAPSWRAKRGIRRLLVALLLFGSAGLLATGCQQSASVSSSPEATAEASDAALSGLSAVERYVRTPDPAYSWQLETELEGEGFRAFVLRMTSQTWLTAAEVDRPEWWHWLTVVVPDEVTTNKGFLYISGGDNDDEVPGAINPLIAGPAVTTKSITAELRMVPNQPISFVGDDYGPRVEDELIAHAWLKFLEGGARDEDVHWLPRLPMTKAAVRALDTVSAFAASSEGGEHEVDQFVVAGGSKRGWTTWTTAIADDRVIAIAPIVIDLLNVRESFEHHWRAYGFWAPAVGDYEREGIMSWQQTPEYQRLLELVDPFQHLEELALPKLLLNATGDQFFLPDSWQFYWDELPGEKNLRYVPNSEHSMGGTNVAETFLAFYESVLTDTPRPEFAWSVEGDVLRITADERFPPTSVTLWQADNPLARDFRVDTIGRAYVSSELSATAERQWEVNLESPSEGYRAYFVELSFPGPGDAPLELTTGVIVRPDTLPFDAPTLVPFQKTSG